MIPESKEMVSLKRILGFYHYPSLKTLQFSIDYQPLAPNFSVAG